MPAQGSVPHHSNANSDESRMAEVRRTLEPFVESPGEVGELRVLEAVAANHRTDTLVGYSDDLDAMAKAALSFDGKAMGVYVTLNRPHPALKARAPNRLILADRKTKATADENVQLVCWLLVDFDACRPSGTSASAEEKP